ncbi:MAG: type IV pilus assembly protein PilC [Candidatus Omnitrophota bacterium]|jgi:type IV pilus assembly protein PilC
MISFKYSARDPNGLPVTGIIDAIDKEVAITELHKQSLTITKLTIASVLENFGKKPVKKHKRVKPEDLLSFAREIATLLEAGVSFLRAIDILLPQITSIKLKDAVVVIRQDISAGTTFKDALSKRPDIFPNVWLHIVEAGEMTGKLPFVLNELSSNMATSEGIKKKVTTALIYPGILMLIACGAILFFVTSIIPVFAELFESFDAELPALTLVILGFSDFVRYNILFMIAVSIIGMYLLRMYVRTFNGRFARDKLLLALPVFGEMVQDAIIARLCVNLSIMLKSGVNFIQSLDIGSRATGNLVYEQALTKVKADVQEGVALSQSMMKQPLFSTMMTQVLMVGEEIGKLDEMLIRVAEYYEARVNVSVGRISALIEPIILVFVGGVIGFLVVAMFLPILTLSSAVK